MAFVPCPLYKGHPNISTNYNGLKLFSSQPIRDGDTSSLRKPPNIPNIGLEASWPLRDSNTLERYPNPRRFKTITITKTTIILSKVLCPGLWAFVPSTMDIPTSLRIIMELSYFPLNQLDMEVHFPRGNVPMSFICLEASRPMRDSNTIEHFPNPSRG